MTNNVQLANAIYRDVVDGLFDLSERGCGAASWCDHRNDIIRDAVYSKANDLGDWDLVERLRAIHPDALHDALNDLTRELLLYPTPVFSGVVHGYVDEVRTLAKRVDSGKYVK